MKYTYKMVSERKTDESGNKHTVYGVSVQTETGSFERVITDIFCDKKAAERFVEACNILSLDPEHLDDVIADALCV